MADNIPTPGGAMPPKPAEASKVQPKKETVRINLPPKPTSAPTIKLPTLAPGSAAPATTAAAPVAVAAVAAAPVAAKAPAAPTPPTAAPAAKMATPATTAKPAAPVAAPRPVVSSAPGLTMLDKGLAIAAAVASLAALGAVLWLAFGLKDPSAM